MRIVAGQAKGRRLVAPPGDNVRPTADRVREALFSSLQPRLVDAHVLDLYAGSGALGLEAASRGAAEVTFVERDRRALDVLRQNIAVVGCARTHVVARPALTALRADALPGAPFDLVLADPPYLLEVDALAEVLAALVAHVAPGAEVVLERATRDTPPRWPAALHPGPSRRYGATTLYRASAPDPEPEPDHLLG